MTWILALLRPYLAYVLIALGATIGAAGFYAYAWIQGRHAEQVQALRSQLDGYIELLKLRNEIAADDRKRAAEAERELEELRAKAQEMTDAMAKDPNSNVECFSAADVERLRRLFAP